MAGFFNVAVDGTYAYFSVESTELAVNGGGLDRVPLAGGPVEVVVATDAPFFASAWVDS